MTEVERSLLHDLYRLDNRDLQDATICKKVRYEECGNNFAPNSRLLKRCVDEVTWLCDNGYSLGPGKNYATQAVIDYRNHLRREIIKELKKNGGKANKKLSDMIHLGGFFKDKNMSCADEGPKGVEGFGMKKDNVNRIIVILIVIFGSLFLFKMSYY